MTFLYAGETGRLLAVREDEHLEGNTQASNRFAKMLSDEDQQNTKILQLLFLSQRQLKAATARLSLLTDRLNTPAEVRVYLGELLAAIMFRANFRHEKGGLNVGERDPFRERELEEED